MPLLLGIDTGGTYTDAVLFDEDQGLIAHAKALTTRGDLAIGIGEAIDAVLAQPDAPREETAAKIGLVSLSTTLATNALVEGQGGRAGLVLIGFGDKELGRAGLGQALGDAPYIALGGGHDAGGQTAASLELASLEDALPTLKDEVSAFAVAGLFAVRNPSHEQAVKQLILERTGLPVTCSHELSTKLDGPRRALTSLLNARLIGLLHRLISAAEDLLHRQGIDAPLMVVRGDGALISADIAKQVPIETILSGPAASLVGARYLTGERDALVADIGGTTSDIAVLQAGEPRLDERGAKVGGWRTMVEAVAMRTYGLGGDSEVHMIREGLSGGIALGPRRLVPVSLFAQQEPELVHRELDRQLAADRPGAQDGRFVAPLPSSEAERRGLSPSEQNLLDRILEGPTALDRLFHGPSRSATLDRLVSRGLVQLSGLTPSDAAHVLARQESWDGSAARKAAQLFARKRDTRGLPLAADAQTLSQRIVDTLVRRSAELLLDTAFAEEGLAVADPAKDPLVQAALGREGRLLAPKLGLTQPVIGLGAPAPSYYPEVASLLDARAVIPAEAGVANAVGAVVSRVRVSQSAAISQPEEGRFRVHHNAAPKDFAALPAAIAFAEERTRAAAEEAAIASGAAEPEITVTRRDKTAVVEGKEIFIEARVTATAIGRPQLAG